jgi:hypothetical protein
MPNASNKLKETFIANSKPLTSHEIAKLCPDLKPSEISMGLNYLKRARYVSRQRIINPTKMARKEVWQYMYHADRLPKE